MPNHQGLETEVEELRSRLAEAEDTLEAIRTGQVDAVVVQGPEGHQVYSLTGAERVYRLLVEAMNEGALVMSPDGSIIYSNHTFAALLGVPLEQVIGSTIYEYVDPQDLDSVAELLSRAIWAPGRKEISLRKKDDSAVPTNLSVGSLDVEQETESISAVITDLTEHKALECELEKYREHLEDLVELRTTQLRQAVEDLRNEIEARKAAEEALAESNTELQTVNEELTTANDELTAQIMERERAEQALRGSEERMRLASEAAGIGNWHWDLRNEELVWDARCKALFGVAADQGVDYQLFLQAIDEQDRDWVQNAIATALVEGTDYKAEMRIVLPDGRRTWVLAQGSAYYDERGIPVLMHGIAMDITDRKEQEQRQQEILERERRIANALQEALIPSQVPRRIDGWSVAARYQPALKDEALVGGDFYDVFALAEGKVGVLIGDVAGKGLAAAIRVAAVRHAVRSYAYLDLSPAQIMTLTNKALCREGADERNVLTAVFAMMDVGNGRVVYANAGHEPPLIRRAQGDMEELGVTGPMLGIIPDALYDEEAMTVAPGDDIVMFTDGVTEARTGLDFFSNEGVKVELKRVGEASPDDIAEALLNAAKAHTGSTGLQDDVAIVVLGYEGSRER